MDVAELYGLLSAGEDSFYDETSVAEWIAEIDL